MTPTLGVAAMLVRGFLVFCLAVFFIAAVLRGALAVYAIAEGHNGFAGWVAVAVISTILGVLATIAMIIFAFIV